VTSSKDDEYAFAGADMTSFVCGWLAVLDGPKAVSAGLLEDALYDPVERDRYFYGAMFIAANSGPRAAETDASGDELRLFAVLAVFQQAGFPGTDATLWEGAAVHVRRAFDYANSLTPSVVARRLRQGVIDRAVAEDPPGYRAVINRSMKKDPARCGTGAQNGLASPARDPGSQPHRPGRGGRLRPSTAPGPP
jgi:hypothetical protein